MASKLAEKFQQKYFGGEPHPYQIIEHDVQRLLQPQATLLDAGCGRTAPVLVKYRGQCARLIGIDLVDFSEPIEGLELYNNDLGKIQLADNSVDLIMSRSVFEHIQDPAAVYREMFRVLKPGGRLIFLTANWWDYASMIAAIVPNRWHPWIVSKTEGRAEEDVFPIQYKTNTRSAVRRLAKQSGFEIESFKYLGQYPCYFMFNGFLFLLATAYEKIITHVAALNFLRGWIYVTLKKPA